MSKGLVKKGEMLCAMIRLATVAHAGQFDKGGRPYILHPLTVMHRLRTEDEELQCIAVGHDVIEDTVVTSDDLIKHGMSDRVVEGILALTKREFENLAMYKARVFVNNDAVLVKMEDLRHNSDIRRLKGIGLSDFARIQRYHTFWTELRDIRKERGL